MGGAKVAVVAALLPVAWAIRGRLVEESLQVEAAEALPEAKILQMRRDAAQMLRAMYPLDDYWMETCQGTAFNPFTMVNMMQSFLFQEAREAFPEVASRQDLIDEYNSCIVREQLNVAPPSFNPFNPVPLANMKPPSFNPFNPFEMMPKLDEVVNPIREQLDPTVKVCKALRTCTLTSFEKMTMEKASPSVSKAMRNFVDDVDFPEIPQELKKVILDWLLNYFDKSSTTMKLPMATAYLQDLPPPQDIDMKNPELRKQASKAMGGCLQGAGPFAHKMLQSTGDKVSAELQEVLASFKDAISPMTHRELMHQVKAAGLFPKESPDNFMIKIPDTGYGPSGNYIASSKATASASIGQGHLVRGTTPGAEKAWLKVMRRFLEEKLTEEYAILDSFSPAGGIVQKAMREVKQSVRNELDWEQEARFMRRGHDLYHGKEPGLRSVALYQALPADRPVVLVMEALGGSTLSAWISKPTEDPKEACEVARMYGGAFRVWSKEALAGSGFFHGDPHAGNLMVDFSKGVDQGALTLIDYGNSFEVEDPVPNLALPFLVFLLGCLFDSPGLAVQGFDWQNTDMKAKAAQDIKLAWKDFHILEGSIGWLAKAKGLVAAWADVLASAFGVAVQSVPIALVGSALSGWTDKVHTWVALAPDELADELQMRVMKAFTVLFTYQHSVELPHGLFGFSRALDLFTNSFKQIRDKKGDMMRQSGCDFHLQHPLIQIVNSFAQHGATKLVTQSYKETIAGSNKLVKDIIAVTWNR